MKIDGVGTRVLTVELGRRILVYCKSRAEGIYLWVASIGLERERVQDDSEIT